MQRHLATTVWMLTLVVSTALAQEDAGKLAQTPPRGKGEHSGHLTLTPVFVSRDVLDRISKADGLSGSEKEELRQFVSDAFLAGHDIDEKGDPQPTHTIAQKRSAFAFSKLGDVLTIGKGIIVPASIEKTKVHLSLDLAPPGSDRNRPDHWTIDLKESAEVIFTRRHAGQEKAKAVRGLSPGNAQVLPWYFDADKGREEFSNTNHGNVFWVVQSRPLQAPAPATDKLIAGVGLLLNLKDEVATVVGLLPGSPAAKCERIHVGDRLLSIAEEGKSPMTLAGKALADAALTLRGPAGSEVRLILSAPGREAAVVEVTLVREQLRDSYESYYGLKPLQPGTAAPRLPFVEVNSKKRGSLNDYLGKVVVVGFWSTSDGRSVKAMDELQKTADKFAAQKDRVAFLTCCLDADLAGSATTVFENFQDYTQDRSWLKTVNGLATSSGPRRDWNLAELPSLYVICSDGVVVGNGTEPLADLLAKQLRELP